MIVSFRLSLSLACTAALLTGCAYGSNGGGRVGETGHVQVVASAALPEPSTEDAISRSRTYLIGPQDILIIDVFGLEGFSNREIRVDNSGRIALPLTGSIVAAGSTPDELATTISELLRQNYMRNPLVSVNVQQAVSQFVTIDGQVSQPGNYPVLNDMTLMRAVASARGLGEFADQDDVVVIRSVQGQRYVGVYNIAAIRRGNYPDPKVYANDIIIVGDSAALRRMRDLVGLLPAVTAPLIYLLDSN